MKHATIDKLITCLFFLLVISIPTSKAGMNLFSSLLAIAALFYLPFKFNSSHIIIKNTFFFCIACFLIGLIGPIFINLNISDILTYVQKNIFLLVIPIAAHELINKDRHKLYMTWFIFACLVASFVNFWKISHIDFSGVIRAPGLLDYSRHNNALLLGMSFCIALITPKNKKTFLWLVPTIVFVISIIVSGTRGGWVGAIAVIILSIIAYHRYLIIPSMMVVSLAALAASYFLPNIYDNFESRAVSIVDIKNDHSNNERINTWRSGIEYIQYVASEHPKNLLFGSGMNSTDSLYRTYMNSLDNDKLKTFLINGHITGGTDFHNGIIDVVIKSGFVFFITLTYGFLSIYSRAIKNNSKHYLFSHSFIIYGLGFIVTLPFYSLIQDYSIFTMSLIIPLSLSEFILNGANYES